MDPTRGRRWAVRRTRRARRARRVAGLAAALALAGAADAAAATPHPGAAPGAFCTRTACADRPDAGRSTLAGFALATFASVGLGRRRASRHS